MLSQYGSQLSLIVPQYSDNWLDYLLQRVPGPVFRQGLTDDAMLHLHRVGSYDVELAEDMYALSALLVAIIIHDWRIISG
jgi:hypothetical protein